MSDVEDAVDLILQQWRRERPDLDCSPMGVVGRISQLQREVHLAQRATFARHGLDVPSFDVLAALRYAHRQGVVVVGAAGCGLKEDNGDVVAGKRAFVQSCGGCHTLARAGTQGVAGPNLDEAFRRAVAVPKRGLGDTTIAPGAIEATSPTVISSLRRTSHSAPSWPRYCTRL